MKKFKQLLNKILVIKFLKNNVYYIIKNSCSFFNNSFKNALYKSCSKLVILDYNKIDLPKDSIKSPLEIITFNNNLETFINYTLNSSGALVIKYKNFFFFNSLIKNDLYCNIFILIKLKKLFKKVLYIEKFFSKVM